MPGTWKKDALYAVVGGAVITVAGFAYKGYDKFEPKKPNDTPPPKHSTK